MDESREAEYLSSRFLECLEKRQNAALEWNARLKEMKPPLAKRISWRLRSLRSVPPAFGRFGAIDTASGRRQALEAEWRAVSGKKRGSLAWALNDVMVGFWAGGLFKVAGDTAQLTSTLVIKTLIVFSREGASVAVVLELTSSL